MELVVIAAGRGSRFTKAGIRTPKPLVQFREKPLFWWAAESSMSSRAFSQIHFAVLREHVTDYKINKEIEKFYPQALIHIIEDVTSGAAETAALVAKKITSTMPIAFVDCDLAFSFAKTQEFTPLLHKQFNAALCLFRSSDPAFSYAIFNKNGEITGTVEKKVCSEWAIGGLYAFQSANYFLEKYSEYQKQCTYSELFLSGIMNNVAKDGKILPILLPKHLSLGTPSDIEAASKLSKLNCPLGNLYDD